MSRLTDLKLKNLKYRASEKVGSRGEGALLFERRSSGVIEIYYRYRIDESDRRIKIGWYDAKVPSRTTKGKKEGDVGKVSTGLSLAQARKKVIKLAALRDEHPYLKEWLELAAAKQVEDEREAVRQLRDMQLQGTLSDLVDAYIGHLERQGKQSADKAKYLLDYYVIKPFPDLAKKRAFEITSEDIVTIIRRMLSKNITTTANRVRSYLMAAYNFARRADNDPRQANEHGKRFGTTVNPVDAVPRQQDFERVRERTLSNDELVALWNDLPATPNVGVLMSYLVQLVVSLGGQRPQQLLACKWSDYDFDRRQVTIIDSKGRRAIPRKHVVPLTKRAVELLAEVEKLTGEYDWPFTINGKAPYTSHALSVAISRYLAEKTEQAQESGDEPPDKFVSKDIRRTCKQLMIDAGLNREQRNLLQNHGLTGVDIRHYDHDDHLSEKRQALQKYDRYLKNVLAGKASKVVDISTAKK